MRRQSCFWVFAVVFQSFKNYFVPNTFPNKGISVYVLKKYGTFIHSILYTQDFLACWQNSHHIIEKKEVGHLGRHHNIRYNIVNFSVIGIKSKTEVLFCEEFTKVYKIIS